VHCGCCAPAATGSDALSGAQRRIVPIGWKA